MASTMVVKPTNHAMQRLQERFPREWRTRGFENCAKAFLHLSEKNIRLFRVLFSEAKKVNSIINDKAMAVYCLERFKCENPVYYVVGDIVFVMNGSVVITVIDKQQDARNHIKGFDAPSSKRKKDSVEVEKDIYITEGSLRQLVKEHNPLLTYTTLCEYSPQYSLILATYKDREIYFLKAKPGVSNVAEIKYFETFEDKAELAKIRAWLTAMASASDIIAKWVFTEQAELVAKYKANLWLYQIQFERQLLTFSWNPAIQQGAILDFPIHSQSRRSVYITMTTFEYIRHILAGGARQMCAVAYNHYLYELTHSSGETHYVAYEPGTEHLQVFKPGHALYPVFSKTDTILAWFDSRTKAGSANVYRRTQRQTEVILFNDPRIGKELEARQYLDSNGERVWLVTPWMLVLMLSKGMNKKLDNSDNLKKEALSYSIQLQHDKRAYAIVDSLPGFHVCSVDIGEQPYYYTVAVGDMHQVASVYDLAEQSSLRSLYSNLNLIRAQLPAWVESGRAHTIVMTVTLTVVGVQFDGHFFIFEKQAGHSVFTPVTDRKEAANYLRKHKEAQAALSVKESREMVLVYANKGKNTYVAKLLDRSISGLRVTFYNKWNADLKKLLWRQGIPPTYVIWQQGETPRYVNRNEYGEIVRHLCAASTLISRLSEMPVTQTDDGKIRVEIGEDRIITLWPDSESEALCATKMDFMSLAHWYKEHFSED